MNPTTRRLFRAGLLACVALLAACRDTSNGGTTPGGRIGQVAASTLTPMPVSSPRGASFANRCAQPHVVKCNGFDAAADFNIGAGGVNGAYGQNNGILPPSGTADYSRVMQDPNVKAS